MLWLDLECLGPTHLVRLSLASIASSWKILLRWQPEDRDWQCESVGAAGSSAEAPVTFSLAGESRLLERGEGVEPLTSSALLVTSLKDCMFRTSYCEIRKCPRVPRN